MKVSFTNIKQRIKQATPKPKPLSEIILNALENKADDMRLKQKIREAKQRAEDRVRKNHEKQ